MNDENKITEKSGEISGYASVFDVVDGHGDVILKGAFKKAVNLFKKGIKKPKFLWQHDVASPIGIIDELFEDDYGLFVRGHLLLDIPKAREACSLIKNKAINGFSIGYNVRDGYEKDGKKYINATNVLMNATWVYNPEENTISVSHDNTNTLWRTLAENWQLDKKHLENDLKWFRYCFPSRKEKTKQRIKNLFNNKK